MLEQQQSKGSRKAGGIGDTFGSQEAMGPDRTADDASQQQTVNPAAVAEEGFIGTAVELPYRKELESSFGVSFAGVRAYTDEHARRATTRIGAQAYAMGNQIAFNMKDPSKDLVAHELTHVLQQTGGGPAKKTSGTDGAIEKSGEAEAEAVESSVKSGKPASGALQGDASAAATHSTKSPSLKQSPARSEGSKFGTGMQFSPTEMEKFYSYNLWRGPEIEIPIPAVPGLEFIVSPDVRVKVGGGVDWHKKAVTANVGVEGGVAVGLGYGNSHVAQVYADMEASVFGGMKYERSQGENGHNEWELFGGFTLATDFVVGVKLGGGIMDTRFAFGHCDVGKLTGLSWKNGHFEREKLGWEWGAGPKAAFAKINEAIKTAQHILTLPKQAAQAAWNQAKGTINALGGFIKSFNPMSWF